MDIEKIKSTGKFTWGIPLEWYNIDCYTILKFNPWKVNGYIIRTNMPSDKISYHGWINGKDTYESWPTLETCIAGLIGYKYSGNNNGGVGYYFCKMVDAPPYDKKGNIND